MAKMKFSPMEAFIEAVHHVFLKLVFFDKFLIAVASAAGLDLVLAAYEGLAVLDPRNIMRGAVAVETKCAINLLFFKDVFPVLAGEHFLVDIFMALCA